MPESEGVGFSLEGFLREHIRAGESTRAIGRAFRAEGGRMGNDAFRAAVANERQSMLAGPRLADIPTSGVPGRDQFVDWRAGRKDMYVYRLNMDVFDRGIGGIVTQPWIVQSDQPISVQDAIDQAVDDFANGDPENPNYGWGRVTTVTLDQLRYTV